MESTRIDDTLHRAVKRWQVEGPPEKLSFKNGLGRPSGPLEIVSNGSSLYFASLIDLSFFFCLFILIRFLYGSSARDVPLP